MNWKEAEAARLAFQRCAWALGEIPGMHADAVLMQIKADEYSALIERLWRADPRSSYD